MTRRTVFLIGLVLHLLMVFGLFVPYAVRQRLGTPVTLQTVPVDPRSVFRGDYVTLRYDVGNLPVPLEHQYELAYVLLAPGPNDTYQARGYVLDREDVKLAEGEVCLRGRLDPWGTDFPDLAQYFVPEGTGRDVEETVFEYRLLVEAAVTPDCRGIITGLDLGPPVTEEERRRMQQGGRLPPPADLMTPPPERPVPPPEPVPAL